MNDVQTVNGWLNTKEAAQYGRINHKVLERLAKRKKIRSGKIGRAYRFRPKWIDDFLEKGGFDGTIPAEASRA